MTYLLDTNAWVDYIRGKNSHLLTRLNAHLPHELSISTIVLSELYYGAYHSGVAHISNNLNLIQQLLLNFPLLEYGASAANEYGKLRHHLASLGQSIGPNDTMIAASALDRGLILVTHNTAEFSRVPGLQLEDWQIP